MYPAAAYPLASFSGVILGWLMAFLSFFLILLILVQRGRGGGLSGALGGPGGQSAFGSKAGDTFTIITVAVAGVWIFVCAFTMWLLGMHNTSVADFADPNVAPGPGDERAADDLASGLVVPTTTDDLEDKSDEPSSLVPAMSGDDASTDSADEDSSETEKPAEEPTKPDSGSDAEPASNPDQPNADSGEPADKPAESPESTPAE